MAKAKTEGKSNKSSGTKKLVTIIGVLAFIAIIVVIIVLSIPANTYGAVERLNEASQSSFLENESEKTRYEKSETKIAGSTKNYYNQEVQDIKVLSGSINKILDYYNEYLILADDNKVFSKNYKIIKNNLEDANTYQDEMNNYLIELNNLNDNSDSHLQYLWIDFRQTFSTYLSSITSAIDALNNCYQGCFNNTFTNNLSSTNILNTIDDFLIVISNEFNTLVETDLKNYTQKDYNYQSHGKIILLDNFVNNYIVNDGEITRYYFDESLQTKYNKINSFYQTYNLTNFTTVIESIEDDGKISLTFQQQDTDGIYSTVKEFLGEM